MTIRSITGDGDTPTIAAAVAHMVVHEDPPLDELLARFPDAPRDKVAALRESIHQHFPEWFNGGVTTATRDTGY